MKLTKASSNFERKNPFLIKNIFASCFNKKLNIKHFTGKINLKNFIRKKLI